MKNSGLCYSGPSTPRNIARKSEMNQCQGKAVSLDQIPTQDNKVQPIAESQLPSYKMGCF